MNNLGYSNNNYHIGNVKITNDLEVDGDLDVTNINVDNITVDNITATNASVTKVKAIDANGISWCTDDLQEVFTLSDDQNLNTKTLRALDATGIEFKNIADTQIMNIADNERVLLSNIKALDINGIKMRTDADTVVLKITDDDYVELSNIRMLTTNGISFKDLGNNEVILITDDERLRVNNVKTNNTGAINFRDENDDIIAALEGSPNTKAVKTDNLLPFNGQDLTLYNDLANPSLTVTNTTGQIIVNSNPNDYSLPSTRGTVDYVLTTDGAGVTSWGAPSSSIPTVIHLEQGVASNPYNLPSTAGIYHFHSTSGAASSNFKFNLPRISTLPEDNIRIAIKISDYAFCVILEADPNAPDTIDYVTAWPLNSAIPQQYTLGENNSFVVLQADKNNNNWLVVGASNPHRDQRTYNINPVLGPTQSLYPGATHHYRRPQDSVSRIYNLPKITQISPGGNTAIVAGDIPEYTIINNGNETAYTTIVAADYDRILAGLNPNEYVQSFVLSQPYESISLKRIQDFPAGANWGNPDPTNVQGVWVISQHSYGLGQTTLLGGRQGGQLINGGENIDENLLIKSNIVDPLTGKIELLSNTQCDGQLTIGSSPDSGDNASLIVNDEVVIQSTTALMEPVTTYPTTTASGSAGLSRGFKCEPQQNIIITKLRYVSNVGFTSGSRDVALFNDGGLLLVQTVVNFTDPTVIVGGYTWHETTLSTPISVTATQKIVMAFRDVGSPDVYPNGNTGFVDGSPIFLLADFEARQTVVTDPSVIYPNVVSGTPTGSFAASFAYVQSDDILRINSTDGLTTTLDNTLDIGSSSDKFRDVYCNKIINPSSQLSLNTIGGSTLTLKSDNSSVFSGGIITYNNLAHVPQSFFSLTSDVTVENTTTETTLIGSGSGSVSIPYPHVVGCATNITTKGLLSDVANPTIRFRVYLEETGNPTNSVLIADTNNFTLGIVTLAHFMVDLTFVFRSVGVSGSLMATGFVQYDDNNSMSAASLNNVSPVSIDTTLDWDINITVEWGTASLSNTITNQITIFTNKY